MRGAFYATLMCAALLLPGCGTSTKPTLRFIGDSITYQSTAEITSHYAHKFRVAVFGVFGIDTYEAGPAIAVIAKRPPDVVVINLGTNDARRMPVRAPGVIYPGYPTEPPGTIDGTVARLKRFGAAFPASTCEVWVTINDKNRSWGPANARRIDTYLRTLAHVADWAAQNIPADFDKADDPHPNETGRRHLLTIEDAAIRTCKT